MYSHSLQLLYHPASFVTTHIGHSVTVLFDKLVAKSSTAGFNEWNSYLHPGANAGPLTNSEGEPLQQVVVDPGYVCIVSLSMCTNAVCSHTHYFFDVSYHSQYSSGTLVTSMTVDSDGTESFMRVHRREMHHNSNQGLIQGQLQVLREKDNVTFTPSYNVPLGTPAGLQEPLAPPPNPHLVRHAKSPPRKAMGALVARRRKLRKKWKKQKRRRQQLRQLRGRARREPDLDDDDDEVLDVDDFDDNDDDDNQPFNLPAGTAVNISVRKLDKWLQCNLDTRPPDPAVPDANVTQARDTRYINFSGRVFALRDIM